MQLSSVFTLLLQVALILTLGRVMGTLALRLRQPKVVGEMLAGIMLGPSLLGWFAPWVFPSASIPLLNVLAQMGVILFLFLIGLELDVQQIRQRGRAVLLISQASILVPFAGGALLCWYLYTQLFAQVPHRFATIALFMGAAMSITAFPVLARILSERGLTRSSLGSIAIACAAVVDVLGWCALAFVVAYARAQGWGPGLITGGLASLYVLVMLYLVKPQLNRLETLYERPGQSSQTVLAMVLVLAIVSAAATEWIGIHALFGAFLMGVVMPKGARFSRMVREKLEDLTVIFLLPIFFAYAGLRTQIGLLASGHLWLLTGLIIAVACLGKFGGSALAARLSGLNWREASAIGVLLNTRGLMELVILTIGLDMGVITPTVFAMMVIMALVTTAMTTPVLHWVYPRRMFETTPVDEHTAAVEFGVLIPISRPESGPALARIASLLGNGKSQVKIYGLTLQRPAELETFGYGLQEESPAQQVLGPLLQQASDLKVPVEQISFPSRDVPSDIARVARAKRIDLVMMGFHKPVIGNAILGGTVHRVLTGTDADVAILVDRGLPSAMRILVPYQGSPNDRLAVELAGRLATSPGVTVTILHVVAEPQKRAGTGPSITRKNFPGSVQVLVVEGMTPVQAVLGQSGEFDLALIGLSEEWGLESHLFGLRAERIAAQWQGSLLLVRKYVALTALQ